MGALLDRDWGSLEDIKKKMEVNKHQPGLDVGYDDKLRELAAEYEKI